MAEETILTGDDLMMGPPSPMIPPELASHVLDGIETCSSSLRRLFHCKPRFCIELARFRTLRWRGGLMFGVIFVVISAETLDFVKLGGFLMKDSYGLLFEFLSIFFSRGSRKFFLESLVLYEWLRQLSGFGNF